MKKTLLILIIFQFADQNQLWAQAIATPDTLRFGPVRKGTSVLDSIAVVNRGDANVILTSWVVQENAFQVPGDPISDTDGLLPPAQSLYLRIGFEPQDLAVYSSDLVVETSSGDVKIHLMGEGVREVVVIQEILADPPSDLEGDANGDGVRHRNQDEFVELLNIGFKPVRLDGWQLSDAGTAPRSRFTFPENSLLEPGGRTVLFGGGSPTGFSELVFVDDGTIGGGLNNRGDAVFLIDPTLPDTLASAVYGTTADRNQSLVRHPQGRGPFVRHSLFPGNGALFSPGRARAVIQQTEAEQPLDETVTDGAALVIDEVLADPATGPNGDANRDGVRDSKADEFIEIWNVDSKPVTIGGWWLSDDDVGPGARFHFPDGTVLEPGTRAVLFGGGKPKEIPGRVFVDDGSIGNGLTNKGDLVLLVDPVSEDTVAVADFRVKGDLNRSVVRLPDGTYVPHPDLPEGGVISPGRPHPTTTDGEDTAKSSRPVFLDDPPSWCRVGALCRFVPRIRNLNGGFVRLETRVHGVTWDRSTGEIVWRPDKKGRFRFWQTAVSGTGATTVRQFDVWVEARPKIAIVEILADPPNGINGDVNGDGTRDGTADEFVEILNEGPDAVWITDWRLSDDDVSDRRQFRFPEQTRLQPGERAVLFGGGRPAGVEGLVFADDGSIGNGLTNQADVILLIDPVLNDTLARASYQVESDIDQSLVWDGTGWIPHQTPPGRGVFSPGLPSEKGTVLDEDTGHNPDGRKDGGVGPDDDGRNAQYPPGLVASGVIVHELLANPASGPNGDANGDGVRHGYHDEFIEVKNAGTDTAFLDGCRLGDDDAPADRLFEFPAGTVLPPGRFLVLFGGGSTADFPGRAFVDDGRIGDGLSNSGDTVVFLSPDGADTLDVAVFDKAPEGTSLVRREDHTLQRHDRLPFIGLFSPGRAEPRLIAIRIVPDTLILETRSSRTVAAEGIFNSGDVSDVTDNLNWTVEDSSIAMLETGMRLRGVAPGETAVRAWFGRFTSNAVVRILSETADEKGDSSRVVDNNAGSGNPPSNLPPEIYTRPDTLAIAGLAYLYRPKAEDPEGDPVVLMAPQRPSWLRWAETGLTGVPEHTGLWPVVIAATDGSDTTEQAFNIRVVRPGFRPEGRPDSVAYVGVTWRTFLEISDGIQTQIDGGPDFALSGGSLVWRPEAGDLGQRVITVSMSGNGVESLILTFKITVRPRPQIRIDEILVDPTADVNGDGHLDRYGDQFIELLNAAGHGVDLAGWTLGDDGGEPFTFARGTVLKGGDRLTLFGGGRFLSGPGRFSAGGRIGDGLADEDRILLIAPDGPDTLVDAHFTNGQVGASLVPDPENPGEWLPHNQVSNLPFSPGLATTGPDTALSDSLALTRNEIDDPVHPFPNPFNLHTTIGFRSTGDPAEFTVYNILGQPVRRISVAAGAGFHQLVWDGRDNLGRSVGTGVYLIHLRNGIRVRTMRVVLLK